MILESLKNNDFSNLQSELLKKDAVEIRTFLVEMDKKANKMFKFWADLIIKKKNSRGSLYRKGCDNRDTEH